MKNLLLLVLAFSFAANAKITTYVMHLEEGVSNTDDINVLVSFDGRVFNVDPMDTTLVETLRIASEENLAVELEVEEGAEFDLLNKIEKITSARLIGDSADKSLEKNLSVDPLSNYQPTDLGTFEYANKVFRSLEQDHRRKSQCYNRAYIWSKRMNDRFGIKSMKIFIFYTLKYREEVSGKWWFHVAPMVNVAGEYYAMDREFTRKPYTALEWEKRFTRKIPSRSYNCAKMTNIDTFYDRSNSWSEYCYIQYSNMYFWAPRDLRAAAREGKMQTRFTNGRIKAAAKEGFKKWKKVYESLKIQ